MTIATRLPEPLRCLMMCCVRFVTSAISATGRYACVLVCLCACVHMRVLVCVYVYVYVCVRACECIVSARACTFGVGSRIISPRSSEHWLRLTVRLYVCVLRGIFVCILFLYAYPLFSITRRRAAPLPPLRTSLPCCLLGMHIL